MGFVNYARAGSFPHSLATKQLHLLATREEVGETQKYYCTYFFVATVYCIDIAYSALNRSVV